MDVNICLPAPDQLILVSTIYSIVLRVSRIYDQSRKQDSVEVTVTQTCSACGTHVRYKYTRVGATTVTIIHF